MKEGKKVFGLLFLISILTRISKNAQLNGDDAFVLSWYAWAIRNGIWSNLLQKPLVWIGAYPMSGYPILTEFILAFFLAITSTSWISWHLTSFVLTSIGFFSCYSLLNDLEVSPTAKLIILGFFMFSPMFLLYTYGSIGARATFLSLLPLFVKFEVKVVQHKHPKNLGQSLLILILLLLSHRVSFLLIPIWILSVLVYVYRPYSSVSFLDLNLFLKKYSENSRTFAIIFLFSSFSLGLISTYIFPLNATKIGPSGLLPFSPGIFGLIELLVDQMLRQGIAIAIFTYLIIEKIVKLPVETPNQQQIIELICLGTILPWFIFLPIAWYVSLFLVLPVSVLAGLTLERVVSDWEKHTTHLKILTVVLILYIVILYLGLPIFVQIKLLFLLLYGISTVVCFGWLVYQYRIKSDKLIYAALVILIISSMFYVETQNTAQISDFPYSYLSGEEMLVGNFLEDLNIEGRILSSNYQIGTRLAGITGLLFYEDPIGGSGFVSNFTSIDEVERLKQPVPFYSWWKMASVYSIPETVMIDNYGREVFTRDPTDPWVIELFHKENTLYVVLTKDFRYTVNKVPFDSVFIDLLLENNLAQFVFETEHLVVARLNYLDL